MLYDYIILAFFLYIIPYVFYLKISHGLGNKAIFLQMRRFIPCSILAVLPAYIAQLKLNEPFLLILLLIAGLWIFTYPSLYWLSNHKVSSDFEFHFETVFALYFTAWITSLFILCAQLPVLKTFSVVCISIIELLILMIPVAQLIYYMLYKSCINENGMQMIQETDCNEVIEFFKSMSIIHNILIISFTAITLLYIYIYIYNSAFSQAFSIQKPLTWQNNLLLFGIAVFMTCYLWKRKHGVFVRTAIVEFYLDIKEYLASNNLYKEKLAERLNSLTVVADKSIAQIPATYILVIGESASRDYMQAFNDAYPLNTTPWLNEMKNSKNFILFPNSFSTVANTVYAVSRALTECNQYNDKQFYDACSIIDIAHKAGFKVHWYSNQGHLGSADTPVTLIANTADTAKWTKETLNKVQYDAELIPYLKEVNPAENNFVVIHLKGSHFNFLNRYPKEFTKLGTPGKYQLELNYANTIAYTDHILQQIFKYAKNNLNLQSMVYFSDHATIPDKRRSPNFEGLASVRIPLFTYFSDSYLKNNPEVYNTLLNHADNYWTNDLAYELLCSILNVKSNKFDETNSLASPTFKYKREDLRTCLGKIHI